MSVTVKTKKASHRWEAYVIHLRYATNPASLGQDKEEISVATLESFHG